MTERRTIDQHILAIYAEAPHIVNNDDTLTAYVWTRQGWSEGKTLLQNLQGVSRQDEITRRRRKLHEEGKIKYSKEVEEARFKKYKEKTEEYGQGIPGFPIDPFEGFPKVEVDEETNTARMF